MHVIVCSPWGEVYKHRNIIIYHYHKIPMNYILWCYSLINYSMACSIHQDFSLIILIFLFQSQYLAVFIWSTTLNIFLRKVYFKFIVTIFHSLFVFGKLKISILSLLLHLDFILFSSLRFHSFYFIHVSWWFLRISSHSRIFIW